MSEFIFIHVYIHNIKKETIFYAEGEREEEEEARGEREGLTTTGLCVFMLYKDS